MSTSGGVIYHLRAYRFAKDPKKSLWSSHFEGTRKFLEAWNPTEKTLVLIGSSGGYSLPKEFIAKFEKIIAVEPDPLARFIFEKRFERTPEWIKEGLSFHDLKSFQSRIPDNAAILFSNVLGQVSLPKISEVRRELKSFLSRYSWASYHDALSGEGMQFDSEVLTPYKKSSLAEMKNSIYPMGNSKNTLTVNAHEAPDLFLSDKNLRFFYWQWMIIPKRAHLIEGVFLRLETHVNV